MRNVLRGHLLAVVLVATALHGDATARQEALGGVYLVEGMNPDGVAYTGVVELTATGAQWHLAWTFEPAGTAIGFGVLQGDVLAVIFQTDGGLIGLAAYAVERSTTPMRLRASWIVPGAADVMTETLVKTVVRDPALLRGPRQGV